ncbi:MAG: patatin-like phospholipase family protein [Candidatus Eremiobacteraeota bacterium]|nr:patatin-like phospholipase family protein [Candidatus Eremiobacteraeota bacterium]
MPRFCDIVMKGGITSGIVYPAAVVEIAKKFVFKNVGGTSAGAIAAALTAAAERRRAFDGSMAGFDRLAAIPDYLATDNRLFRLFVPNDGTASLFRTITGLFGRPRFKPAAVAQWCGLVWAYPLASALGAIPGLLLIALVLIRGDRHDVAFVLALLIALLTTLSGISVAFVIALTRDVLKRLPRNFYGMVTGVDDRDRASDTALCTWLTRELEIMAGLEPGVAPLTFGMLWDAKRDPGAPGLAEKPAAPDVNLEMITTNVTWGRPYRFPLDVTFFFAPDEMRRFFPDHVVQWMIDRARAPRDAKETKRFAAYAADVQPKYPLPLPGDLPVMVATRMSLAFPVLLCAVPMWVADFSQPIPANDIPVLEHCWFSDGGISSNFPVAMFDAPLPRWPTFAINLAGFPPNHPQQDDEAENVYMPSSNAAGRLPTFNRFAGVAGFLGVISNAMQNWNDNTQSVLPGYRDRIVTVFLSNDEGGLNLDMPPSILKRLRARGAAAGALIASRFEEPSTLPPGGTAMNWENHRWLRYRSTMGALKEYLAQFEGAIANPEPPDVPYDALIRATDGTPVHSYPIAAGARDAVAHATDQTTQLATEFDGLATLDDRLPKPPPNLVVRADLGT